MTIDGLIHRPLKTVDLHPDFFETPTTVTVGFLPPIAEAKIREARLGSIEFVPKGSDYVPRRQPEKETEADLRVRNLKLEYGVREHTIESEGKPCEWGPELWEALDVVDPRILQRIIREIDEFGRLREGDTGNPI